MTDWARRLTACGESLGHGVVVVGMAGANGELVNLVVRAAAQESRARTSQLDARPTLTLSQAGHCTLLHHHTPPPSYNTQPQPLPLLHEHCTSFQTHPPRFPCTSRAMDACLARFAPGHAMPALADEDFNAAAAGLAPSASALPGTFALPATDVSA